MKIFISWSGSENLPIAKELKTLVSTALGTPVDDTFFSDDIAAGSRALEEIDSALIGAGAAFVLASNASMRRPWLNYELGALGARIDRINVTPIALDLPVGELISPLIQFQAIAYNDRAKMLRTLLTLNDRRDGGAINPDTLRTVFDAKWDAFSSKVGELIADYPSVEGSPDAGPATDDERTDDLTAFVYSLWEKSQTQIPRRNVSRAPRPDSSESPFNFSTNVSTMTPHRAAAEALMEQLAAVLDAGGHQWYHYPNQLGGTVEFKTADVSPETPAVAKLESVLGALGYSVTFRDTRI